MTYYLIGWLTATWYLTIQTYICFTVCTGVWVWFVCLAKPDWFFQKVEANQMVVLFNPWTGVYRAIKEGWNLKLPQEVAPFGSVKLAPGMVTSTIEIYTCDNIPYELTFSLFPKVVPDYVINFVKKSGTAKKEAVKHFLNICEKHLIGESKKVTDVELFEAIGTNEDGSKKTRLHVMRNALEHLLSASTDQEALSLWGIDPGEILIIGLKRPSDYEKAAEAVNKATMVAEAVEKIMAKAPGTNHNLAAAIAAELVGIRGVRTTQIIGLEKFTGGILPPGLMGSDTVVADKTSKK